LLLLVVTMSVNITGAHAQSVCSRGDRTYIVVWGDTLSGIAWRYKTNWPLLASHNHIANPNLIYPNQVVCIPQKGSTGSGSWQATPVHTAVGNHHSTTPGNKAPAKATSTPTTAWYSAPLNTDVPTNNHNVFPYPACTWWANQRFYQVHGVFVPWTTNSEAWQWTARAHNFGWHVSSRPKVGSIIDLQPWVQGAYGGGHVAYVEQVLGDGHVIASNTSWGANPYQVTYVEFAPGPGVTFISE
jgi:N-acetylmuramoyl-L-alanine amidase